MFSTLPNCDRVVHLPAARSHVNKQRRKARTIESHSPKHHSAGWRGVVPLEAYCTFSASDKPVHCGMMSRFAPALPTSRISCWNTTQWENNKIPLGSPEPHQLDAHWRLVPHLHVAFHCADVNCNWIFQCFFSYIGSCIVLVSTLSFCIFSQNVSMRFYYICSNYIALWLL